MTLFRHISAAIAYARYMPRLKAMDHEDEWTDEDKRSFTAFMNSPTGQKLRIRLERLQIQSALSATQATHNPSHKNGWASGISATLSFLREHEVSSRQNASDEPEQSVGAAELFERYAP